MTARCDLRLYALLDPAQAGKRALPDLAREVVAGGATLLQYRDKTGTTREMIATCRALREAVGGRVPLLVNDRVDVALAAGADGVHLGQDDMEPHDARRLLGEDAIIGLTVKSIAEAETAPLDVADYVCIGGIFTTTSKDNPDPPVGLPGLRTIAAAIRARAPRMPVGAIAGITADNAAAVIAAGADGVAVISALSRAVDPAQEARHLRAIVDAACAAREPS